MLGELDAGAKGAIEVQTDELVRQWPVKDDNRDSNGSIAAYDHLLCADDHGSWCPAGRSDTHVLDDENFDRLSYRRGVHWHHEDSSLFITIFIPYGYYGSVQI